MGLSALGLAAVIVAATTQPLPPAPSPSGGEGGLGDRACHLAAPPARSGQDLEIDGDFADVPKLSGPASPKSCTGQFVQAWFPSLEDAVRARHGAPECPPKLSPVLTDSGDYQNPITSRRLVLDTSAGGGYACCEQPTFYVYVDPVENVFWIHDYQAALHKQVRNGWWGPFAASAPRTRADALPSDADALATSAKAYVERFASTALETGEIPADLGCENPDFSRLLVRERVKQLGAMRGHGPLQAEVVRTGQPQRTRALVTTSAQFANVSAPLRFSLELHDGRWILLHLAFDLSPEDSRRLLSSRPASLAPASPSRAISVRASVQSGGLDATGVERVVGGSVSKLVVCRAAPNNANPDRSGKLSLALTVGASGNVEAIRLKTTTFNDPNVGRCATDVIRRLRFASPQKGQARVAVAIEMP